MKKQLFKIILLIAFLPLTGFADTYQHNIAGFISQGFMYTSDNMFYGDTKKGSFQFNEIGININKRISPKMKTGIQLLSYTIGDIGKNEIEVDWGFADYTYNRFIGVRAGILKAPLGFYNESRDIDSSLLYVFLPSSVYQVNYRDTVLRLTGIGFYGEVSTGIAGDLNYQFIAGKPDLDEDSPTARAFYDNYLYSMEISELNVKTDYIINLKWYTPLEGVLLSWVYRDSEMDTVTRYTVNNSSVYFEMEFPEIIYQTLSARYEKGNIVLNWELFDLKTTYIDPITALTTKIKKTTHRQGWYVDIQLIISDWLQMGGYYSKIYGDIHDKKGESADFDPKYTAWQEDICFSTRIDVTDSWIFKSEIHLMDGTMAIFKSDHIDNNNKVDLKEDWTLFVFKLSYLF